MEGELSNNSEINAIRNEKGQLLPGVVLNPAGKPKGAKHLTTLLQEAIKKVAEGDAEPSDVLLVKKTIEKAKAGDFKHLEHIWDRLEGKAPQKIEVEGIEDISNSEKIKELSEKFDAYLTQHPG